MPNLFFLLLESCASFKTVCALFSLSKSVGFFMVGPIFSVSNFSNYTTIDLTTFAEKKRKVKKSKSIKSLSLCSISCKVGNTAQIGQFVRYETSSSNARFSVITSFKSLQQRVLKVSASQRQIIVQYDHNKWTNCQKDLSIEIWCFPQWYQKSKWYYITEKQIALWRNNKYLGHNSIFRPVRWKFDIFTFFIVSTSFQPWKWQIVMDGNTIP